MSSSGRASGRSKSATMHWCLFNASHWKLYRDLSTFSCAFRLSIPWFNIFSIAGFQYWTRKKTQSLCSMGNKNVAVWFPNKWADRVHFMHSNMIVSCQMCRIKHGCYVNVLLEYDVIHTIWTNQKRWSRVARRASWPVGRMYWPRYFVIATGNRLKLSTV